MQPKKRQPLRKPSAMRTRKVTHKAASETVASETKPKTGEQTVTISPPNFQTAKFKLVGTAPYVQARFAQKAMEAMKAKMREGQRAKKGSPKAPRDFDADFEQAQHKSEQGWIGVPAGALRNACIDVCRMVGFKMTHAKMSVFFEADGNDAVDGTPLIKLDAGKPERLEMAVRNATGVADIRIRPMWRTWKLNVRVRYDADQFSVNDVTNLLHRAGIQIGIGEGRPYSKDSNGLGYGTFELGR